MIALYPHQERVAAHLRSHRGVLCIHSTGTGKTLTSAASLVDALKRKTAKRAVVWTKKSAIAQFRAEVVRYWPDIPEDALEVTTVWTFFKNTPADDASGTFLVIDEAHEFVNEDGVMTAKVAAFAKKCTRVMLLTATPIVNTARDLFVLTSIVKGVDLPSEKEGDAILSSPVKFKRWFRDTIDLHIIDKDADPNYPRKHENDVAITMSATTKREYARQLKKQAPFYINLRQLSLGFGNECEKCDWLVKKVREWIADGEGKIVVYTAFIERGAKLIRQLLLDHGVNVLTIDGETSAEDRRRAAVMFNKRPEQERAEAEKHQDLRKLVQEDEMESKKGTRCGEDGVRTTRISVRQGEEKDRVFRYTYFQGSSKSKKASPEDVVYTESLKIPPAWTPAEVCHLRGPSAKLTWVAMDGKGHWQYRYSEDWSIQQEYLKVLRLKGLDSAFWKRFDQTIVDDLASKNVVTRALAIAVLVLSTCHIRIGSRGPDGDDDDEDDDDDKDDKKKKAKAGGGRPHYGLTTLLKKHVKRTAKGKTKIEFVGKSDKVNVCEITDAVLRSQLNWLVDEAFPDAPELFGGRVNATMVRAYLERLHPALRPKDFRTYYANLELLQQLRSTSPLSMTPRQRSRTLSAAYKVVSKGLNNTPKVARDSYVFTGLWVLYLADPLKFHTVLKRNEKNATTDLLRDFIDLFDSETIDWRYMLKWFKETKGLAQFMGPAQVLLITDAGSESIDLAGTRHIVLLDPTWTPALENQIIGRGQRFGSHAHLPENQRVVDVWKLSLVKETKGKKTQNTPEQSVERYIMTLMESKRKEQAAMYKRLAAI